MTNARTRRISWLGTAFVIGMALASCGGSSTPKVSWSPAHSATTDFTLMQASCTSPSFCLGMGNTTKTFLARTTLWNGSTWSIPRAVGTPDPGGIRSLSCVNPTFCEALSGGAAYRWNGKRWSSAVFLEGAFALHGQETQVTAVSRASADFCMAVDSAGDDFTFDGQKWSGSEHFDSTTLGPDEVSVPTSVSCPSATSCMVGDADGYALRWNGTSWLAPEDILPPSMSAISCPTPSWCMAMDHNSYTSVWNGREWSGPEFVDPESMHISQGAGSTPVSWSQGDFGLLSVSCASRNFCVAVDDAGYALSFDGTSWSSPVSIGRGLDNLETVTCAPPRLCVVNINEGQVVIERE
jgi:hypothetical protein